MDFKIGDYVIRTVQANELALLSLNIGDICMVEATKKHSGYIDVRSMKNKTLYYDVNPNRFNLLKFNIEYEDVI